MKDERIEDILSQSDIFGSCGKETLKKIAACKQVRFAAGDKIYSADSYEKCLGVVLSGKVEMFGVAIYILFRILAAYVLQAAILREEQELTV